MERDHDILELFADDDGDELPTDEAAAGPGVADDVDEVPDDQDVDEDDDLLALVDEATARSSVTVDPAPSPSVAPPAGATPAEAPGAVVLQYPSADFPPPPVFRLRVPEGWLAVPVPEAQMAVRRPEPVEGFHPNVLVRVRRTPPSATVAADLRRLTEVDDAPEGMEVLVDEVRTDLATPARSLRVRFAGPEGLVLEARHLMVYVPATDHVANVVSVVGTWPAAADPAVGHEVETVVASLRLLAPTD